MPGGEVWLVGERRATGAQKKTTSRFCQPTQISRCSLPIKATWACEQTHQQLKEELGLDHIEGRSWVGLQGHALMTMIAYAFLQSRRLRVAGRKKRIGGPPPQPSMPAIRQAILDLFARPHPTMPAPSENPLPLPIKNAKVVLGAASPCLSVGLQLCTAAQDPEGPDTLRIHVSAMDDPGASNQPEAPQSGTKQLGNRLIKRIQIRAAASLTTARYLRSCFTKRVATALKCLILLKNRSTKLR